MKYFNFLLAPVVLLLFSCGNSNTGGTTGKDTATAESSLATPAARARAAAKLNPDTLFYINQFKVEMSDADGLWKKFPLTFFAKKNDVNTYFDLDKCKLRVHKDSMLKGITRFFPPATDDSTSIGIRIVYGLDNALAMKYYFQIMLLKYDTTKGRSIFFNVTPYDGKYYAYANKWVPMATADVAAEQKNYIDYTWKVNDDGDSSKIAVVDGDEYSDAKSVTIPWVEIVRIIKDNDEMVALYNKRVQVYNDSMATPLHLHHKAVPYKEVPAISDLLFQCAPRLINNGYYHTINLRPDLANTVILLPNAVLTYAAANYTAMCPPNCDKLIYRKQ